VTSGIAFLRRVTLNIPESHRRYVLPERRISGTCRPSDPFIEWRPETLTTTVDLVKKVCLIGEPGVGKTSLIRRFVLDLFDDHYVTTIGAKVTKKELQVDLPGHDLRANLGMMIWDVSGQKDYKIFHEIYLNGMEGALVVADLSRQNTFTSLKAVLSMAERTGTDVPMAFLLNKADLAEPSPADLKDVRTLAAQNAIPVLATSAKTGLNVELAFMKLGGLLVEEWLRRRDARAGGAASGEAAASPAPQL
jgi:small GTP-binding protein